MVPYSVQGTIVIDSNKDVEDETLKSVVNREETASEDDFLWSDGYGEQSGRNSTVSKGSFDGAYSNSGDQATGQGNCCQDKPVLNDFGKPMATGAAEPSYPEAYVAPLPPLFQILKSIRLAYLAKFGGSIAAKTSRTVIPRAVGAAPGGFSTVLQSGGQALKPSTLKALNFTKEQGRNAIHGLKKELGLPNNFHGKVMGNGDYLHPSTGKLLGNLLDYTY